MNVDWTISLGNILTALGMIVTGLWWSFRLSARSERNQELARSAMDRAVEAKTEAANALKAAADLRLEMTRDFASVTHLKDVEARLATTIQALTDEIRSLRSFLMESNGRLRNRSQS